MSSQLSFIFVNPFAVLPPSLPCPGVKQKSFIPQRSPRKAGSAADFFLFWGFLWKDFLQVRRSVSGMLSFFSPSHPCPSAPSRNFSTSPKPTEILGLKISLGPRLSCRITGKLLSIFSFFFFISVALLTLREAKQSARSSSPPEQGALTSFIFQRPPSAFPELLPSISNMPISCLSRLIWNTSQRLSDRVWGFLFPWKMYYEYFFLRSVLSAWHQRAHLLSAPGAVLLRLQRRLGHERGGKLRFDTHGAKPQISRSVSEGSSLFWPLWTRLSPRAVAAAAAEGSVCNFTFQRWAEENLHEKGLESQPLGQSSDIPGFHRARDSPDCALCPSLCWDSSCIPWARPSGVSRGAGHGWGVCGVCAAPATPLLSSEPTGSAVMGYEWQCKLSYKLY